MLGIGLVHVQRCCNYSISQNISGFVMMNLTYSWSIQVLSSLVTLFGCMYTSYETSIDEVAVNKRFARFYHGFYQQETTHDTLINIYLIILYLNITTVSQLILYNMISLSSCSHRSQNKDHVNKNT